MSILEKIKNIKNKSEEDRATRLYERHPMEGAELDVRLQYISALSLLTALEREPTIDEVKAVEHMGQALGVDQKEAQGIFAERANVSTEDIECLFAALKSYKAEWNYLADLAWLHSVDGNTENHEKEAYVEAMNFLGLDPETTEGRQALQLPLLMLTIRNKNAKEFVAKRYHSSWPTELDAVLAATTEKMWPILEKDASDFFYSTM